MVLEFNMKWISVDNKLPNDGEEILIFSCEDKNNISIGYRKHNFFFDLIDFTITPINVTHWMPLPEPPKYE